MPVIDQLPWAKMAVEYVRLKLPYGAGNNEKDGKGTLERWAVEGKILWQRITSPLLVDLPVQVKHTLFDDVMPRSTYYKALEKEIVESEAGNCEDQSLVALMFLYRNRVRPIDLMYLTNRKHAFVVIGKETAGTADPSTWGGNVVICDPWNNAAFRLLPDFAESQLIIRMRCGCGKADSQWRAS